MLFEQIIEFELMGPGYPGRTFTPKTEYFHDKTKISKGKSSSELIFPSQGVAGGNVAYLASHHLGQVTYKI